MACRGSATVFEAPAVIAGFHVVAAMSDTIEECGSHLGIAEHGRPFAERQVGGDDHRGLLVEIAKKVEQELATGTRARQVTQFIQHDQVEAAELAASVPDFPRRAPSSKRVTRSTVLK